MDYLLTYGHSHEVQKKQVEIDMKYNGLCHTDIHMRDNDWGITNYPLVAGHEGIGTIRRTGMDVKTHKVGDVVGVTWIRDSCRSCDACLCGRENICRTGYQVSANPIFIFLFECANHAVLRRAHTLAPTLGAGGNKALTTSMEAVFQKL